MRGLRTILAGAVCGICIISDASAGELSIAVGKDTFLRNGAPNTNEGANKKLSVRKVGRRRALFSFDLSTLASQIPAGQEIANAEITLFITNNNKVWGKKGNRLGVHRLKSDWIEGSGSNATVPKVDKDTGEESDQSSNRGSGIGSTWNCAADSNVKNTRPNCNPKWRGGNFVSTASDLKLIKNTTTGEIGFNVTQDVTNFVSGATQQNFGWLIKKQDLSKAGGVWFASKESATNKPTLEVGIGYTFPLTGAEEVPPVTTSAAGQCRVWLGADGTTLNVRCTHTVPNPTASHIHTGAAGADGSVLCDLGSGTSPISATCTLDPAGVSALNSGGLYLNVHTSANPGGEIRGQIQ